MSRRYTTVALPDDGRDKTKLIRELAIASAQNEPMVRELAAALVRSVPRYQHVERLRRLHRFVVTSVDYHREPIEMLHPASITLREGGDCDDHTIALGALAWSMKYPFRIVPHGDPSNPDHYTIDLGFPEAEWPEGDERTNWIRAETSIPAELGEDTDAANARLGPFMQSLWEQDAPR